MWDKLLPEPLPEPYRRAYTLVINLDETLVKSSWDVSELLLHESEVGDADLFYILRKNTVGDTPRDLVSIISSPISLNSMRLLFSPLNHLWQVFIYM